MKNSLGLLLTLLLSSNVYTADGSTSAAPGVTKPVRSDSAIFDDGIEKELVLKAGGAFSGNEPGVSLAFMASFSANQALRWGMGFSWEEFENDSFISLFLTGRYLFNPEKLSPMVNIEAGFSLARATGVFTTKTTGPMIALGAGVNLPIDGGYDLFMEFGYKIQWTKIRHSEYSTTSGSMGGNVNIVRLNAGVAF
jgi:hypothetical protein